VSKWYDWYWRERKYLETSSKRNFIEAIRETVAKIEELCNDYFFADIENQPPDVEDVWE